MSLPHTMRASLEVRPARVLALGKVLRGEGINKTDTPNKGWEKDRVPTCASRIL